jgi:hypothetical protein
MISSIKYIVVNFLIVLMATLVLISSVMAEEVNQQSASGDYLKTNKINVQDLLLRIEELEKIVKENKSNIDEKRINPKTPTENKTANITEQEQIENASLIEAAFKRTLIEEGGLLLKPGQFNYVPTISYTHSSSDRIVINGFTIEDILVIGDIVSKQVRRDLEIFTNTFRLGLKNNFQLDFQIPIGHERFRSFSSNGDATTDRTSGLGDISLALSYQLIKSSDSWPDTLVNISWKSTSGEDPYSLGSNEELALGSGFESWGLGLTTVTVSDPVVFFSGISLTKNLSDRKQIGKVDTGDSIGIQLGMIFAINLNTSLSYGFQLNSVSKTKIDYQNIPGSDLLTSMFTVGVSRILTNQVSMDVEIAIGLTRDSPDVQLSLSFPYNFM